MVCKRFRCLKNINDFFFFIKNLINLGTSIYVQVNRSIPKLQVYRDHSCFRNFEFRTSLSTSVFALSSAYTPLKSHISGFNILCILRFAKNCTRENKDSTFDHKIAKFDTRENFRLYGILVSDKILILSLFVDCFYRKGPALTKS